MSETAKAVDERISFFLSLEDDVRQFYSIARRTEPLLSEGEGSCGGSTT